MKKRKHEEQENSERWLLSYADFITLLMVFFIIMYSMSAMNEAKFQALAQSLSSVFQGGASILNSGSGTLDGQPPSDDLPSAAPQDDSANQAEQDVLMVIDKQLQQYLTDAGLQDSVVLTIDDRGLVVSLGDAATFDSGSAEIKASFVPQLLKIAEILNGVDNYIRIEGHTDNVPETGKYKSNWELSTARATSLVQLFIQNSAIPPAKLSAVGYGEYRPVAVNDTAEGRAKNRRVDIVVIRSKFNSLENAAGADLSPDNVTSPGT